MSLLLLAVPLFTSLSLSFLFEQLLTPRPKPVWQRHSSTTFIHVGTWLILFTLMIILLKRPWFSITILLAFQLFLFLVNQAKFHSLREAFFYQDFEYFTDAIKNPRLYLPFFGISRTILAFAGIVVVITLGIKLESAFIFSYETVSVSLFFLLTGIYFVYYGLKHTISTDFEPNDDLKNLGQIAFFWKYWQEEKNTVINTSDSLFVNPTASEITKKPDIVVVQSESFFDPRLNFNFINPDILTHFDQINSESSYFGRLQVPAWGANTVRTECGFLTGLSAEKMGIHQFNPYRFLAKHSIPNLVSYLKQSGYLTICIHPYPASFYQRNKVFPLMGFDRFLDIDSFNKHQKSGQYIGDLAVGEKINDLLQNNNNKPLFIFTITMENHGPLHLEKSSDSELNAYYSQQPPEDSDDLTVYIRHLKNADLMIKEIKESLQKNCHEGLLCWYGDHVPIMPKVYENSGVPDGLSNYFIWQTATPTAFAMPNKQDIVIHELASIMLDTIK